MIIECCYHPMNFGFPLYMGEKEPILDKRITSGVCEDCFLIEQEKNRQHHEKRIVQDMDEQFKNK